MRGTAEPWHTMEIAEDRERGILYGAVKTGGECGCDAKNPCPTLRAYYDHNVLPGGVPLGEYRIRLGIFGVLEVESVSRETEG